MPISVVFISNKVMTKEMQDMMRTPMTFLSFAFIDGKMYKHFRSQDTFVINHGKDWGNTKVYGALLHIQDFMFYATLLDAYYSCSKSSLYRNHKLDIHHRINVKATPITFSSISEFGRLLYTEKEKMDCHTYVGNLNHPKINQRLNKTHSYRVQDGVDKIHFKQLYREVKE